jgi:hypothetical protein
MAETPRIIYMRPTAKKDRRLLRTALGVPVKRGKALFELYLN